MDEYTDKLDLTIPKVTEATSTVTSEYRNWVGPHPVSPDGACYREAHFMDTCPSNFDRNGATNTCWAECPLAYPVECGMQCIRQSDDCAMETLNKIGAVGNSVMAIAAFGAFQKLLHVSDGVRLAFECANIMIGTMRSIIRYIRNIKTTDPTASTDKIMNTLYQSGLLKYNRQYTQAAVASAIHSGVSRQTIIRNAAIFSVFLRARATSIKHNTETLAHLLGDGVADTFSDSLHWVLNLARGRFRSTIQRSQSYM
ncbi:uncharacterized protein PITG_05208 [Phytophthora infestans T30-4]|uniref:Uncharacterized protein n=1 Tax=Phytophthora infestans (strain T30-4) TaxID=403677 RepID=D0N3T3_PHYIT|nr:uncharacterized protein PITG_05208 [Phytophthora infestans T30-4]EEY69037.1 conserved hypothetical protein [Phytophthora infestans T30-4]|eukprot:XP_002998891.1 conserved hypothetical protein [Phytophthora infestans T30-4]